MLYLETILALHIICKILRIILDHKNRERCIFIYFDYLIPPPYSMNCSGIFGANIDKAFTA